MTEQEAEALAERLERVWLSQESRGEGTEYRHNRKSFQFEAVIHSDIRFYFSLIPTRENDVFLVSEGHAFLRFWLIEGWETEFGFPQKFGPNTPEELIARLQHLADEWMPFFRRCCWLCGCDIEATMHEKAE